MPDLSKQPRRTLTWEELCRDPNLHDLPFKIETNDRGQIVMSPRLGYITKRRSQSAVSEANKYPWGASISRISSRS